MFKKSSIPMLYWVYVALMILCIVLLPVNFIRTDSWTGDKPFSEFTQHDWQLLTIFLMEELIILGVLVLFAALVLIALRLVRMAKIQAQYRRRRRNRRRSR